MPGSPAAAHWLRLASGHTSAQLAALSAISEDLRRLSPRDARRQQLLDGALWPALTAFDRPPLPALAARTALALASDGTLPHAVLTQQLVARSSAVQLPSALSVWASLLAAAVRLHLPGPDGGQAAAFDAQGPAAHPFLAAAAKNHALAEHLVVELSSELTASPTEQDLLARLALHGPFVSQALRGIPPGGDLSPGAAVRSDVQLAVLELLLSLLESAPKSHTAVAEQISRMILACLAELPAPSQEYTIGRMHAAVSRFDRLPCRSILVFSLTEHLYSLWHQRRFISSHTCAFVASILLDLSSDKPRTSMAECAAVIAVAASILIDAHSPAQVDAAGRLLLAVIPPFAISQRELDPLTRAVMMPLLATMSLPGLVPSQRTLVACLDFAMDKAAPVDPLALLSKIQTALLLQEPAGTASKTALERIVSELVAAQASARCLPYAQVLGVAISLLDPTPKGADLAWHSDALPHLSLLAIASRVFAREAESRSQALKAVASQMRESHTPYLLKLFSALLFALKNEPEPDIVHQIVTETIPALTALKDPFLSSACIRVALSSLQGGNLDTIIEIAGVQALVNIWAHKPRTWTQLRTHLFQWLHRFKGSRGGGRKKTPNEQRVHARIESFVLETVQSLCKEHPTTCGYDLLPFVIQFAKIPFASPQSRSMAIRAISSAIRNNLSSPQAAWNVVMQGVVAESLKNTDSLVLEAVCDYFATVGEKMIASEHYMLFAADILEKQLMPLSTHEDLSVRNAAFEAMAGFQPPQLFPLLPPHAEFIAERVGDPACPDSVRLLLGRLVFHECTTMRRPVFKGLAAADGVVAGAVRDLQGDAQTNMLSVVRRIGLGLAEAYESGKIAGAARAGLAVTVLLSVQRADRSEITLPSRPSPKHLLFASVLNAAVKDMALTDYPLARFETIDAWRMFWRTAFAETARALVDASGAAVPDRLQVVEAIFGELAGELVDGKLDASVAPSVLVNAMMAASGAVLAAHDLGFANACDCAADLADRSITLVSASFVKTDTRASVLAVLASLARAVHSSDDVRLKLILDTVFQLASHRNDADDADIVATTAAAGASRVLHHVLTSSTLLGQRGVLAYTSRLLEAFGDSAEWNAGAAMGLCELTDSSIFDDFVELVGRDCIESLVRQAVARVRVFAGYKNMESGPADDESVRAALSVATGLLARLPHLAPEDYLATLERAVKICQGESRFDGMLPHVLKALYRETVRLAGQDADEYGALLSSTLASALDTCSVPKHASHVRQAHLFALRGLLGLDHTLEWEARAFAADSSPLNDAVTRLAPLLTSRDDPKVVRACGWIVGSALWSLGCVLDSDGAHSTGRRDPRDYRRLNVDTSFVRNLHEQLRDAIDKKDVAAADFLVDAFLYAETVLPAADWSDILARLWTLDDSIHIPVLTLASSQAVGSPSKSFVNFFVEHMAAFTAELQRHTNIADVRKDLFSFVCSSQGIGRLLQLGGLGDGGSEADDHAKAKNEAVVSPSKVVEVLSPLLRHILLGLADVREVDASGRSVCENVSRLVRKCLPKQSVRSPLHRSIAQLSLQILEDMPRDVATDSVARALWHLAGCVMSDESTTFLLVRRAAEYARTALPKQMWVIAAAAAMGSDHAQRKALEGAFISAVRTAFEAGQPDKLASATNALLNVVETRPGLDDAVRADWIIKTLDLAIVAAGSASPRAARTVEALWSLAVSGQVAVGWGPLRRAARPSADASGDSTAQDDVSGSFEPDLVCVPAAFWSQLRLDAVQVLADQLRAWQAIERGDLPAAALSIAKRIGIILESTVDADRLTGRQAAAAGKQRLAVSAPMRLLVQRCAQAYPIL
ncbi:hypothetical protein HK105_201434 [Polyrhizophydium stewartii]|uniref:DUF3730 domain-containing protein n=1 Tax=Polyrhizophydium stewartii TaxID=2732419 RepID=A0ABR4NI73_9FUNG